MSSKPMIVHLVQVKFGVSAYLTMFINTGSKSSPILLLTESLHLRKSALCKLHDFVCTIIAVFVALNCVLNVHYPVYAEETPIVNDQNLQVDLIVKGLKLPTAMAFLSSDDILVLEKDNGTVRRIINGNLLKDPVLDVSVANKFDRGMLGIAVSTSHSNSSEKNDAYVFIYLTESKEEGSDRCPSWKLCLKDGEPEGNRLYKFRWDGHALVEPRLLLDLPAVPGPAHNGGVVLIGPDDNLYLVTGDLRAPTTQAQNIQDGLPPNGTSGILRLTQDGRMVGDGILGDKFPFNLYYAYGIRNSFGMDFDPVTGNLWDTENGYLFGDEINIVEPGFNSGWSRVQGIWNITRLDEDGNDAIYHGEIVLKPANLADFDGKGKYSTPELFWNKSIGLTSLKFLNSNKLGSEYHNDILVGDYNHGRIYRFDLSEDRTSLSNKELIADRMVDLNIENHNVFAEGFRAVTDIKVGPDGYLYIISFYDGEIYRISPSWNIH
jgi:aldose sugar dehydrogenase